jgi:hypothetical protein
VLGVGTLLAQFPQAAKLGTDAEFVVSMIPDGNGGIYIGTEIQIITTPIRAFDDPGGSAHQITINEYGVYHLDKNGGYKQYTRKNGLGDSSVYAMATDKKGRLWVGHLDTGVSVFNGKLWKNFDVPDGPVGERVFDIQTCPVDGDVWIATSAGITRYRIDADQWEHLTRQDGLLEDQVASLAFQKDGTLIAATQCYGIAVFNRNEDGSYKHAKNITAPHRFGPDNCSPVSIEATGTGLPTNHINQVFAASDGNIWIATSAGLVKTNADLTQLQFVRGQNYAEKVNGLIGGAPKDWKVCPNETMAKLLPHDYVTCIAEDADGVIWVGTRERGFVAIDNKMEKRTGPDSAALGVSADFITCIVPMPNKLYVGLYGGGAYVVQLKEEAKRAENLAVGDEVVDQNFPPLPAPAVPPTLEELKAMETKLMAMDTSMPKTYAVYYGEDWKTKGDWLGRTMTNWAIVCGGNLPTNRMGDDIYQVSAFTEWSFGIVGYTQWYNTDNPNGLWDPIRGCWDVSEWNDDGGSGYDRNKEGPSIWYSLTIPHEGTFRLGMYFFNKDGHRGGNRFRDFGIEIFSAEVIDNDQKAAAQRVKKQEPLVRSRVKDFSVGGVYKQFVLPKGRYYVKIDRNHSHNTTVQAVIIDRLLGEPTREEMKGIPYVSEHLPEGHPYKKPPKLPDPESYRSAEGKQIGSLWQMLDGVYNKQGGVEAQRTMRLAAYHRAAQTDDAEVVRTAKTMKRILNLWDSEQRKEWMDTMHEAQRKESAPREPRPF